MKYKYTQNDNFSDFASGKVLYSIPGASAFPVRLMSEIFQICYSIIGRNDKLTIFDPCCGSAYHLTALAFLHPDKIRKLICSDINPDILKSAEKNLNLLSNAGIENRIREIEKMIEDFGKDSHKEALASALRLKERIQYQKVDTICYPEDMLEYGAFEKLDNERVDIVFADTPYSNLEQWLGNIADDNIFLMLENLLEIVNPSTVIAIATDKKLKVEHEKYKRIRKLIIGKRKISIMRMRI